MLGVNEGPMNGLLNFVPEISSTTGQNEIASIDVGVPVELTQRNLIDGITISEMLLKCNEIEPFLKRIIAGDEKWVKYENIKRKRSGSKAGNSSQTTSKPGLSTIKALLGIFHYELLQRGAAINSVQYCVQLDRLSKTIQK